MSRRAEGVNKSVILLVEPALEHYLGIRILTKTSKLKNDMTQPLIHCQKVWRTLLVHIALGC